MVGGDTDDGEGGEDGDDCGMTALEEADADLACVSLEVAKAVEGRNDEMGEDYCLEYTLVACYCTRY